MTKKVVLKSFFARLIALLLLLIILLSMPFSLTLAEPDPLYLSRDFSPDIKVSNVYALNTQFDKILFSQQGSTPTALPAANHLMLALLVAEKLKPDQEIRISDNALSYNDDMSNPNNSSLFQLEKDRSYSAANLMVAHLFEHSEVAAIALAEAISGNVNETVFLMNQRARELELSATNFVNVTGEVELKNNSEWNDRFDLIDHYDLLMQKSSLKDLAVLILQIQKNPTLAAFFTEKELFTRLPDGSTLSLTHPFDRIFYRSEEGIKAAWKLEYDNMSFSFVSGVINRNQYMILMTDHTSSSFSTELIDLIEKISNYYVINSLVEQGDSYPGTDKTLEGDLINLTFLQTINYIAPVDSNFLNPAVSYISHGPHKRPLARGVPVGKVIFTLADGSQVEAEVGAQKAILYENTYFSRMIQSIQQNPNLGHLLLTLAILLMLILLLRIIVTIKALRRQIKLQKLIRLQEKLQQRIQKNQP